MLTCNLMLNPACAIQNSGCMEMQGMGYPGQQAVLPCLPGASSFTQAANNRTVCSLLRTRKHCMDAVPCQPAARGQWCEVCLPDYPVQLSRCTETRVNSRGRERYYPAWRPRAFGAVVAARRRSSPPAAAASNQRVLIGPLLPDKTKGPARGPFVLLAEREGFEPSMGY